MSKQILTDEELDFAERTIAGLPHIYGFPWYRWAKDFYDSTNKNSFLCAANQISKSSTQIRKMIDWATDQKKWKKLWPGLLPGQLPNQFWAFYPTQDVWQTEFETKWEPDFLPRNEYKQDQFYGWKPVYDKGLIKKIEFNSGVTIYCKSYAQKIKDLQSGSVHAMFLDEECPVEFIPELQARLRATSGYMNGVMTPTLGQEFWRRVFEPNNKEEELYPGAFKKTVSLYDSQQYINGKPSRWTNERIAEVIAECPTNADVQRRVFGRFIKSENLRFESFDMDRNMMTAQPIPKSWGIFAGVDPGSGGKSGHPAAIIFIAIRPDYKEGWVFKGWRGDGVPTANPDILRQFRKMKQGLLVMSQVYDYKDKDFFLVAQSEGESFSMANKTRDEGFGLVNSLFKSGMLKIFRGDTELDKLVGELLTLSVTVDKRKALDDLCDATRYTAMSIPWDFLQTETDIDKQKFMDQPPDPRSDEQIHRDEQLKSRRNFTLNKGEHAPDTDSAEIAFWNELSGTDD